MALPVEVLLRRFPGFAIHLRSISVQARAISLEVHARYEDDSRRKGPVKLSDVGKKSLKQPETGRKPSKQHKAKDSQEIREQLEEKRKPPHAGRWTRAFLL